MELGVASDDGIKRDVRDGALGPSSLRVNRLYRRRPRHGEREVPFERRPEALLHKIGRGVEWVREPAEARVERVQGALSRCGARKRSLVLVAGVEGVGVACVGVVWRWE